MLLCGTVLTVERHQHLSTRLMGLAGEELREKRKTQFSCCCDAFNSVHVSVGRNHDE